MIKNPIFAAISGILLLVVIGFVVERLRFLDSAQKTVGQVSEVRSHNTRCGSSGKGKKKYPCTKYDATVDYSAPGYSETFHLELSAGSARGTGQPLSEADYKRGDAVKVVYDPKNPSKAYQDSLFGVWGAPIVLFVVQLATMFGSLVERKR
jgi:hypothetical protein